MAFHSLITTEIIFPSWFHVKFREINIWLNNNKERIFPVNINTNISLLGYALIIIMFIILFVFNSY
jgi:hypothetical protein